MLAQKQPPFKECVIAHWSSDSAPKIQRGSSLVPKLRIVRTFGCGGGRGAFRQQCRSTVRTAGVGGSANAGMSSEMHARNVHAVCLRFPEEG